MDELVLFDAPPTKPRPFLLSAGNSDLARDRIYTWTLPAWAGRFASGRTYNTCPEAGVCAASCFAYAPGSSYKRFPAVAERHLANLAMVLDTPDLWEQWMTEELRHRRYAAGARVRLHDSGDFLSTGYAERWWRIMRSAPHVHFAARAAAGEQPRGWEPFIVPLRGGGDRGRFRPVTSPLTTVTASGNHHGLVTAPNEAIQRLLVPYYTNGRARPASDPVGTITTKDRWSLVTHPLLAGGEIDLDEVLFRMLTPAEIGRAMAFGRGYIVLGPAAAQVRQYGNAVTPPVAELIVSALVEAITGEPLPRDLALAA